uniref:Galactosylgalactosylxylosylprotein 3-beta-glucuronosyltransferase n=1 Tax=Spodoptera frugiperda TaxID=7108 RepID=A0A2H1W4W8_SPOFR
MPFVNIKKQYLAMGLLIFVMLFLFNTRPVFQCQFNAEVSSYLPVIYGITPTYARLAQKADLTRLSQTLMHIKNLHWVVIEDSAEKTKLVANLLKESNLKYTHLNIKTHKTKQSTASGVEQRNLALDWLKGHLQKAEDQRGVVFFMDDDNTYSLKVFDEVRLILLLLFVFKI